ncbi:MAG: putative toxin-antitoxin system toxin component, PIN family [Symploca sp. SIO2E6]|nr:putative toxin-antitoxin system toxin component, PIN family [Symploca sp. SIO2E6]
MNPRFIVIGTNVFISAALSSKGTAYQAFAKAIHNFTVVQNDETYQEIADRIYKSKFDKYISEQRRKSFLSIIKNKCQFIEKISKITACRDPDDNKFLELAFDSKAEFLITGDKDLLSLKSQGEYQKLIISPREFLALDFLTSNSG